jgi:hypothetical protein
VFDLIRHKRHGVDAVLLAFDLIELEGEDLRRMPIEQRKRKMAKLVRGSYPGVNEVFESDGDILFEQPANSVARGSCQRGSARLTAHAALGEGQEPEGTGREARGGGGLGFLALDKIQSSSASAVNTIDTPLIKTSQQKGASNDGRARSLFGSPSDEVQERAIASDSRTSD